jgi:flagellar basal body-associated protein FliL
MENKLIIILLWGISLTMLVPVMIAFLLMIFSDDDTDSTNQSID